MTYFPDFCTLEFIGRLTADPKVNDAGGSPVTKMRVAIGNGSRKGSEDQLPSTFINVDVWNGQGERCAEYLAKGRRILVKGRILPNDYTNRDGVKVRELFCRAEFVQFLDQPKLDREPAETPSEFALAGAPASTDDTDDIPF